jgi:hypothetical protein
MAGEVPSRAAHRGRQQSRPRRKIIVGTYNVFEAARQADVAPLEYASSNHVVGMYELDGGNALIDLDAEGQRNRLRAVWLSRRDCAELIASCLEATTCHGRWCTACPEIHTGSGI